MNDYIEIKGANIHNLKNVDVRIPKNKLTVITGVSGSGKSSLAFDILYEEGRKRYLLFSGMQFMTEASQPFETITGLSPTVAVEQRIIRQSNPRSTVGTRTKIGNMLAILFAATGQKDIMDSPNKPLSMEMFQRNSPKGMCVKCLGTGKHKTVDEEVLFGDLQQTLNGVCFGLAKRGTVKALLASFCRAHQLSPTQTLDSLTEEQLLALKYGDGGQSSFIGYIPLILQIIRGGKGNLIRLLQEAGYLSIETCPRCQGTGLSREAMQIKLAGCSVSELEELSLTELRDLLQADEEIGRIALGREIITKLTCLIDVGLHHLSLSRPVPTLSGGEMQRLFLASYMIAEMDSIIFIFDEPTIGLHEIEKASLIKTIRSLVDRGNTVIAVEHDPGFMRAADYIVDLGPLAGRLGGELIFQGQFDSFLACAKSRTSPYLGNQRLFAVRDTYRTGIGKAIEIHNACVHNLKHIDVSVPLGMMVGVAGVSGSGKSSLIYDTLLPYLAAGLDKNCEFDIPEPEEEDSEQAETRSGTMVVPVLPNIDAAIVEGIEHIDKCVVIDQRPIGRSKTSCPATYTDLYDKIRDYFAVSEAARERKLERGHFSINSKGGCQVCKGGGVVRHYVGYGNFIDIECRNCDGTGFKPEVLEAKVNGCSIYDVLQMTVDDAAIYFAGSDDSGQSDAAQRRPGRNDKICAILATLQEVGMGYITLGQKTPTISGGESQRIKLARELSKGRTAKKNGHVLYLMDEPTTGLSFHDSLRLMEIMQRLVTEGNSLIVVEHDPYILSNCDYIIEMGAGGGKEGGTVIAAGTPKELKASPDSIIGRYLYET